jgi:hypothetical protein
MANCGLTNALTDLHAEQVPNTRLRGSKRTDFAQVSDKTWPCIKATGLLDEYILKSDHRAIFRDLDPLILCGAAPKRLERPQFRNLKLDDPPISDSYRKLLYKQFECHNIYQRVKKNFERGNADDWSLEDEHVRSRTRDRSKIKPGLVRKDIRSSGSDNLQQGKEDVFTNSDQPRGKTNPFQHYSVEVKSN